MQTPETQKMAMAMVTRSEVEAAAERITWHLRVTPLLDLARGALGGATAFAAVLGRTYRPEPGERFGILLCGSNFDPGTLGAITG